MTEKLKAFCNHCNTHTNHAVKSEEVRHSYIEEEIDGVTKKQLFGTTSYQIVECNGCEQLAFRAVDGFPDFYEYDRKTRKLVRSDYKSFDRFYPDRLKGLLAEKQIADLPVLIRKAYREVIDSYNFNLHLLCACGLRAIVEAICTHYKIEADSLEEKIAQLGANGFIGKELEESLKIHKFLGEYAIGDSWKRRIKKRHSLYRVGFRNFF
jgi:hypothetical protein